MKPLALWSLLTLALCACVQAQKLPEKFYDNAGKPCEPENSRYVRLMEFKDGLWHRQEYYVPELTLYVDGHYLDSSCETAVGKFQYFYPDKKLLRLGLFEDGKKQGEWMSWYNN